MRCVQPLQGSEFWVEAFGSQVLGFGFRVSGLRPRVTFQGFGFRVSVSKSRFSGFGFRAPGFGSRVSGVKLRVSGFGFRDADRLANSRTEARRSRSSTSPRTFRALFRVWGSGFRVPGSGFGVEGQGFGFGVHGFGFRVSGVRSRASDFGWRGRPALTDFIEKGFRFQTVDA